LSLAEKEQLRKQALEVLVKTEISEEKFKQLLQRLFQQSEQRTGVP
jgi:hypothetical protein